MKYREDGRRGRIIAHGVVLEPHEYETVLYFMELGKDVELIPRSRTPNAKDPDFYMDKLVWEAKSPVVNGRRSLERLFYRASTQSDNLIFDLRRLKGEDKLAVRILEDCFKITRRVRNMYIITKSGVLKQYKKK